MDDPIGRSQTRRWNTLQDCVLSTTSAHPAIVSEEDFIAAQATYAAPTALRPERLYLLTGRIVCQECGRLLDAHWTHDRPGYRCRHGRTASTTRGGTRNVYVREEHALLFLAAHVPALRQLARHGDDLKAVIAEYLGEHEILIRCGYYTWQLELDGVLIADGWPPHLARVDNGRRRRRKAQAAM